jgi:SAM-dependent methyltransferase
MQLDQDRLTIGGREYRYYTPLEMLRSGRRTAPFRRRVAGLLWVGLAERCVELPVARQFLRERHWNTLLEIGNVLGYWYDLPPHVIVDKYERGPGILNQDLVDYRPAEPFDVVVSISTLEHIGFDESPRDPGKFLRAVRAVERLRAPGGAILLTVPLGYNPEVDRAVRSEEFADYETHALIGDPSRRRGYREVPVPDALSHGEGLLIATQG